MNLTFFEELKKVPGLEGIIEVTQSIDSIDDSSLNEESYAGIKDAVLTEMASFDYVEVINQMTIGYRASHLSKDIVIEETQNVINGLKEVPAALEMSEYKTKLLIEIIDYICNLIEKSANEYYEENVNVYFELCHENAKIPHCAAAGSAGYDIYLPEDVTIPANTRGKIVKLGWKCALPTGWQFEMRPRSGVSAKTTIRIANTPGTIDADYRDEVGVIIDNFSGKPIEFNAGERIAQLVLMPVYTFHAEQIDDITKIEGNRGGGFGSTGA